MKSGGQDCVSVAKQKYISQNTHSCLVSGSSWPLKNLHKIWKAKAKQKPLCYFGKAWFSTPDIMAAHTHCWSAGSPCSWGAALTPILPPAPTRYAPSASLNLGPCMHAAPWLEQFFLQLNQAPGWEMMKKDARSSLFSRVPVHPCSHPHPASFPPVVKLIYSPCRECFTSYHSYIQAIHYNTSLFENFYRSSTSLWSNLLQKTK